MSDDVKYCIAEGCWNRGNPMPYDKGWCGPDPKEEKIKEQIKQDNEEMMRSFETGATRTDDRDKPDYEGYLSPLVIEEYGRYCLKHQYKGTAKERGSDNWQRGMPRSAYMKSMFRHFLEVWKLHRNPVVDNGSRTDEDQIKTSQAYEDAMCDALCALMFNAMGYLHEYLKEV